MNPLLVANIKNWLVRFFLVLLANAGILLFCCIVALVFWPFRESAIIASAILLFSTWPAFLWLRFLFQGLPMGGLVFFDAPLGSEKIRPWVLLPQKQTPWQFVLGAISSEKKLLNDYDQVDYLGSLFGFHFYQLPVERKLLGKARYRVASRHKLELAELRAVTEDA